MSLCRHRRQYEQLSEFEEGSHRDDGSRHLQYGPLSVRTFASRLAEGPLLSQRSLRVLPLILTHLRLRLEWRRAQRDWTATELNQVIFGNESRFNLGSDNYRVRVRRPRGERLNPIFAIQRHTTPATGQHSNARLHTLTVSQDCFRHIFTPSWPARSPDLSPIERIWNG
ncbi:transposable element Tcb2 transposase [Trichonephila clavipes]|nr:transposable element Tcb2 transposase [Trichonephila clavipes]